MLKHPRLAASFLLAAGFVSLAAPASSFAEETDTSIGSFVQMTSSQQADIIGNFVEKIINDVKTTDPTTSQHIYDYFFARDSKNFFVGADDLNHELIKQAHLLKNHKKRLPDIKDVEFYIKKEIEQHVGITLTETNGVYVATTGAPADEDAIAATTQPATQPATQPNSPGN